MSTLDLPFLCPMEPVDSRLVMVEFGVTGLAGILLAAVVVIVVEAGREDRVVGAVEGPSLIGSIGAGMVDGVVLTLRP